MSAIVPALMVLWYFRERDVFPEPFALVARVFLLGAASVVAVVLVGGLTAPLLPKAASAWGIGFVTAFFRAAIPEDVSKYLILVWVFRRFVEFDEPMDGIVYGVSASMGFAAFENVLYVEKGGFELALLRALTAVPSHGMHGAIMGYFLALAWFLPERRRLHMAYALVIPVLLHGIYDFPLMVIDELPENAAERGLLPLVTFAVLVFELAIALALHARVRELQIRQVRTQEPDHHRLLAFHRPGAIRRRLPSWILLHSGVVLVWSCTLLSAVSIVAVAAGRSSGAALIAMPFYAAFVALGVRLFRTSIRKLNRADSAPAEAMPVAGAES
jgi:RsiW-degrading membrane proteinase PrsW (M82 family)